MVNAQEQIEKFKEFLELNYSGKINTLITSGKKSLLIDFQDLLKFDHELAEELLNEPEETIKAAELSLEDMDIPKELRVRIRFFNFPKSQVIMIKDIRSNHLNKFLAIEGIVRQSSDVRPQVTFAKFECPSCGNTITIPQLDSKFKEPFRCSCGRKGRFRLLSKELVDAQRLIVEETPEALEGGEQPKKLQVFLREDMVEPKMEKKTTPGSKIRVLGIVKEIPIMLGSGVQSIRYDLMMESNFIEQLEETFEELEINEEDEIEIKKLALDPRIYEKLIRSIAPSIYGHEDIKEALVLQLFGGVKKDKKDGTKIRGDMHLLLVGDPGSAKTTLLTAVSKIAPKSRFIAGKGISAAGITATVVKDEFLKGWALEAGALVLCNKGLLCLDEMDKIKEEDTGALHEAMESQIISIAKASIQATLRTETTILAAANPKFGRFDPYQPIAKQIELPPALINRFDLIFTVKDIPKRDLDEKIAKHVLEIQQKPTIVEMEINNKLFKKYISYAKQKIIPKLSDGAIEEIKNFYVNLRNTESFGEEIIKPLPITARQLEALVRLAEASARVRLSKIVTKIDAKRAIRLLNNCLMQVGMDLETGQIDIDRIATGITASQRSKIVTVRELINELDSKGKKTIAIEEIISIAESKNIDAAAVEEVIDKLKKEGEIFEPRHGWISKI